MRSPALPCSSSPSSASWRLRPERSCCLSPSATRASRTRSHSRRSIPASPSLSSGAFPSPPHRRDPQRRAPLRRGRIRPGRRQRRAHRDDASPRRDAGDAAGDAGALACIRGLGLRLRSPGHRRDRAASHAHAARLGMAAPHARAAPARDLERAGDVGERRGAVHHLGRTAVASYTPSAVSWLYYAERVFQLPLGFVGSAVGLVLLSDFADRLAAGDHDGLIAPHNRALEAAMLMAMPAAVALLLLAEPIAQVLFERGAFGPHDTAGTAGALVGLAAGLPLAVAGKVLLQPLFARQEFRAALIAGVLGLAVTVAAGSLLAGGLGALGIGLGAALGFTAHAGAVLLALRARGLWRPDARLFARLIRGAAASLLMAAALFAAKQTLPHVGGGPLRVPLLAGLCLGGFAIYTAAAFALRAVTPGDLGTLRLRA